MKHRLILMFVLMLLIAGCRPPEPYNIHCIDFRIVPEGTVMQNLDAEGDSLKLTGVTTTATTNRYCLTDDAGDLGTGRVELIAKDRINLTLYLVEIPCKGNDMEAPIDLEVYDYGKWWDKYNETYKYTVHPPSWKSNGNYCYTGRSTLATDNYSYQVDEYDFAYYRLEMNPKVLELEDFVLIKRK